MVFGEFERLYSQVTVSTALILMTMGLFSIKYYDSGSLKREKFSKITINYLLFICTIPILNRLIYLIFFSNSGQVVCPIATISPIYCIYPLMYLIVKNICLGFNEKANKIIVHLIPCIVVLMINLYMVFFENNYDPNNKIYRLLRNGFLAQGIIYLILSSRIIMKNHVVKKYGRVIMTIFANFLFHLVVVRFAAYVLRYYQVKNWVMIIMSVQLVSLVILYYLAHTVKNIKEVILTPENEKNDSNEKYQKSFLSEVQVADIINRLESYFEQSIELIDSVTNMEEVAARINVSRHNLSQSVNRMYKMSYYDYINSLRIDRAIAMMESGSGENILEISLIAGFNSKATFNRAFKKVIGKSPSEYRMNQIKGSCGNMRVNIKTAAPNDAAVSD